MIAWLHGGDTWQEAPRGANNVPLTLTKIEPSNSLLAVLWTKCRVTLISLLNFKHSKSTESLSALSDIDATNATNKMPIFSIFSSRASCTDTSSLSTTLETVILPPMSSLRRLTNDAVNASRSNSTQTSETSGSSCQISDRCLDMAFEPRTARHPSARSADSVSVASCSVIEPLSHSSVASQPPACRFDPRYRQLQPRTHKPT